jgi:lysozyme family protein
VPGFDDCLKVVLKEEGGFVNDPQDPGGITNLGVTRRVWEAWVHKAVDEAAMRALKAADVTPLYRANYWNPVYGDHLPPSVALCVFDFGVNGGTSRAGRMLQELVGAKADGQIGDNTVKALTQWIAKNGAAAAVSGFSDKRMAFYKSLSTFAHFGKGWSARCDRIEKAALALI